MAFIFYKKMKNKLTYLIIITLVFISCNKHEIELNEIEQKDCLLYYNDALFTGKLIVRHENGKVQQLHNVLNGELNGKYKTFDYSGGLLTNGEVVFNNQKGVIIKKWIEGIEPSKTINSDEFYTICFCKENTVFDVNDSFVVELLKDSLNIQGSQIGILIGDKAIKPDKKLYFNYLDLGGIEKIK